MEDRNSKENETVRTSRVLKEIFNSMKDDRKFTVEIQFKFEDELLPTLDKKMSMEDAEDAKEGLIKGIEKSKELLYGTKIKMRDKYSSSKSKNSSQINPQKRKTGVGGGKFPWEVGTGGEKFW